MNPQKVTDEAPLVSSLSPGCCRGVENCGVDFVMAFTPAILQAIVCRMAGQVMDQNLFVSGVSRAHDFREGGELSMQARTPTATPTP